MNRSTFSFAVKSIDPEEGIIRGIATTPAADKVGDIVEPLGATFELPLPLHHEHDRKDVVGKVIEATVTPEGIEFVAQIAKDVSDQIAEVWKRVKGGLIPFVSVGFRPIESKQIAGGRHFTKWAWDELSLTTIPANPSAAITAIKSAVPNLSKGTQMSISEQIRQFEAKRAEALAAMDALVTKGVALNADEDAQYKSAEVEVAAIEAHVERLKAAEARQAKNAQPIIVGNVQVEDRAPKGSDFVRYTKALALSRGNPMQAVEIAKNLKYGNRVETVLKAAVAAGSSTSADFSVLVEPQLMANEFIDLLRPETILGKLSPRQVPQNIRLPKATSGTSAGWIGEGKAAPLTNAAFSDLEIGSHKVGAIAVFTEDLLRRSEPAAEALVRDDLLATIVQAIDAAFINSANAGVAGVKPAAITNGASSSAASGTSAAAVRADVTAAYKKFIDANHPLNSGVWVMHPSTALSLAMMRNANGAKEFEGLGMNGGTFEGLPVVTSTNVPGDAINGYDVVLAVQNDILVAEGGLAIDASREASLEFDSAPTHDSDTPTPAQLVSMWQTGAVAIKAIRGVTWNRRRPTAVARISGAKYAA